MDKKLDKKQETKLWKFSVLIGGILFACAGIAAFLGFHLLKALGYKFEP